MDATMIDAARNLTAASDMAHRLFEENRRLKLRNSDLVEQLEELQETKMEEKYVFKIGIVIVGDM